MFNSELASPASCTFYFVQQTCGMMTFCVWKKWTKQAFDEWTSVVGYEKINETLTNCYDKRKAAVFSTSSAISSVFIYFPSLVEEYNISQQL